ncbi:MAG: short-chain dehydrogenase [Dehalococcoidia bacterium]|nr:MAG: short-chain dehydrogenase [Dehalococcoidia bacterium]
MDLQNRVVLVTGASGGIGEALARGVTQEGSRVVLFARREQELRRVQEAIGAQQAEVVVGDVANAADLQRAVAAAVERFGGLDILVNNAGVAVIGRLTNVPVELVERGWRTNVLGPILAVQAAVPVMRQRGGGMIVNISSGMSLRPSATMGVYSMTKAALNLISASLREELRDENIRVLTVFPGFLANDFGRHSLAADEELVALRRATSWTRSSRTSEDAARDIIAAIKADAEVFRANREQPLTMPL